MILVHPFLPGAAFGMEDFARQNAENQNTVYHDNHDFDGLLTEMDYHCLFGFHPFWVALERDFQDLEELEEKEDGNEA